VRDKIFWNVNLHKLKLQAAFWTVAIEGQVLRIVHPRRFAPQLPFGQKLKVKS
jgi:hypothetical protein